MTYTDTRNLPECYRMLNISPGVKWAEVKKSYRALALKFHPDHHPDTDGYENRFKEISHAFKTLESYYQNSRRQEYEYSFDENIEDVPPNEACTIDLETPLPNQTSFFKFILRRLMDKGLVVDLKNQLAGFLKYLEKRAFQLDVEREIKIDSSTVVKGGVFRVRQNKEKFEVPIPHGAWNRMKIRIPHKGETSWFSEKRGDLLLDVQVLSSNFTACVGERDLHYDFPVSIDAIKKRKVHTLMTVQGAIKFVLPRNTINEQTFVLKAKSSIEGTLNTNHIVKVQLSS